MVSRAEEVVGLNGKKKNKQNHCVGGADTQEKMKKKKVSPGN